MRSFDEMPEEKNEPKSLDGLIKTSHELRVAAKQVDEKAKKLEEEVEKLAMEIQKKREK